MNLLYSFPKLNEKLLKQIEELLEKRFNFKNLPNDYKSFLLKHNGGFVSPGFIDDTEETEHQKEITFETPLKWVKMDNMPVRPALISFFGIWLENEMNENDVENWDLSDLILSNANSKEDFDILPDNMISIANCQHPDASDILCISLDSEDYGNIYYNYGMCEHPLKGHGDYYENRKSAVIKKYNLKAENTYELDENKTEDRKIINELKKATFVKVANSFTEFLDNCKVTETEN